MAQGKLSLPLARGFGETSRRDLWWVQPLVVFLVLGGFVVYATWAALQGEHYTYGPYLSPFYSPELWGASSHHWFGDRPGFWPGWLPFSAAMLILWAPGGFRVTCYYYRGAYYKAFWQDPVSCAVGEPRGTSYWGERWFPLLLQNVHRYFAYAAVIFIVILSYDVWLGMWWTNEATGGTEFGIGVGTLVMLVNVLLIASYTFGCHSLRHLVGGGRDEISRKPVRSSPQASRSARTLSPRGLSRTTSLTGPLTRSGRACACAVSFSRRMAARRSLTSSALVGSVRPSSWWILPSEAL